MRTENAYYSRFQGCQNYHTHIHSFIFENKVLFIIFTIVESMTPSEFSVDRCYA